MIPFAPGFFSPRADDLLSAYMVSLLHFNGADLSTTITDESGKTWVANGSAALSTAQYKFGPSSLYLDGSSDTSVEATDSYSDHNFGSGDFNLEVFIRPTSLPADYVYSLFSTYADPGTATGYSLQIRADLGLGPRLSYGEGDTVIGYGAYTFATNTWYHIAASRVSGTLRLFVDGAVVFTGSHASAVTVGRVLSIGSLYPNVGTGRIFKFVGYVDEARVLKGAGYGGGFTPPTVPFV